MKVLITGAHFTPAQAVIEELKKQSGVDTVSGERSRTIIYIGRNATLEGDSTPSVESQILPRLGVKFYGITAGRLSRFISFNSLISLLKIPIGFIQSLLIVWRESPDVCLSFGGYVAVPVIISCWLMNVPIITHEQTLVSGLANRMTGFFADKIAVTFNKDYDFPQDKVIVTGNPIRSELLNAKAKKFPFKPVVLITCGNQGSHLINQKISEILDKLTEMAYVIHQTGDSKFQDYEKLLERKKSLKYPDRYEVYKFIGASEMGGILRSTDLVIGRSGANTLLELAYFGIPALVIPLPYLYKDEQNTNAQFFKDKGLVEVLPQRELASLLVQVKKCLKNIEELKQKARSAKAVVIPEAAKRLALEVMVLGANHG